MPRQSAAALATPRVVVNVKDHRPPPPDHLTEDQKAEWLAITRRLPGDYFPLETHGLLAAYVQHLTTLRLLSAEVDRYRIEWTDSADGLQRFDRLLAMRERESRALSSLATRLRISPQSRRTAVGADRAAAQSPPQGGRKPWELHGGCVT
jgi:hypothetical protein